jgi:putative Holliday junction resolvase
LLNNPLTKYIGIDYGKKRTGISISDYDKIISFPLETVETTNLLNFLKDLTKKEKIEKIIIGKPLKLNSNIHLIENEIVEFIKSINKSFPNITIHRVDERFTSKISKKILNLILESYLIKTTK